VCTISCRIVSGVLQKENLGGKGIFAVSPHYLVCLVVSIALLLSGDNPQ
jgi:hypothetical protein